MKISRFLLVLMMIIPWLTFPLLGQRAIKRFLPAAIFITIINTLIHLIAEKRQWWRFSTRIHPKINGSIPFILGPHFLAAFWSLKRTYGKFQLFLITSVIGHLLFAFLGMKLFKRLGIVSLVRINEIQLVLLFLFRALLLYGFQFAKETIRLPGALKKYRF